MKILILFCLYCFISCTSSVPLTTQTGSLFVNLSGIPEGTIPNISVSGPNGFNLVIHKTSTIQNLVVGNYKLSVEPIDLNGLEYIGKIGDSGFVVKSDQVTKLEVIFAKSGNAVGYRYNFISDYKYSYIYNSSDITTFKNYYRLFKNDNYFNYEIVLNCVNHIFSKDLELIQSFNDECRANVNGLYDYSSSENLTDDTDPRVSYLVNGFTNNKVVLDFKNSNIPYVEMPYRISEEKLYVSYGFTQDLEGRETGKTISTCIPHQEKMCQGDGDYEFVTIIDRPYVYPFGAGFSIGEPVIWKDHMISVSGDFPQLPKCQGSDESFPNERKITVCSITQSGNWKLSKTRITTPLKQATQN